MDHPLTLRERALALLGTWSHPPDFPSKLALGLAALVALFAALGGGQWLLDVDPHASEEEREAERRRFVAIVAFAAALSSLGYASFYLRGGPRIIDATTYFLEGRALSNGSLAWTPPPGPSASYAGRFLIRRGFGLDGDVLGGIFPPGYPLLLSLGFAVGMPMLIGPLLAAALVVATYRLARLVGSDVAPGLAEPIARIAAFLSLGCAALRYHTADTMSHAASALGITLALTAALRVRKSPEPARLDAVLAGLALGFVFATRPVSTLAIGGVVLWLVTARAHRVGRAAWALAGMLPGIGLLLLSQRAVTGAWFESTQRMYYALSDGPPGCFRWGFGKGTGCLFEHRDFVEARLANGYGLVEAVGTTLRRLHAHLMDVANFEPLALLAVLPLVGRGPRLRAAVLPLGALVALQMLAYAPFYFDGDYPGGGARFFADVLPIEHVLVALGMASIAPAVTSHSLKRVALGVFALSLAGFAVHASYEHTRLRDRDGGRPMFEPDVLESAGIKRGLILVDTDHGFALGHDPTARPNTGILVARHRGDANDWLLWQALGRPQAWRYEFAPNEPAARLTPFHPDDPGQVLRFESESEWPALAQERGFAVPTWVSACASGKRALLLTPEPGQRGRVTITVPVPHEGEWVVTPTAFRPSAPARAASGTSSSLTLGTSRWNLPPVPVEGCIPLEARKVRLKPPAEKVVLEGAGASVGLDAIDLRELHR